MMEHCKSSQGENVIFDEAPNIATLGGEDTDVRYLRQSDRNDEKLVPRKQFDALRRENEELRRELSNLRRQGRNISPSPPTDVQTPLPLRVPHRVHRRMLLDEEVSVRNIKQMNPPKFKGQQRRVMITCMHCKKKHSGECHKIIGACYRCGQMGHLFKNCPLKAKQPTAIVQMNQTGNKGSKERVKNQGQTSGITKAVKGKGKALIL